MNKLRCLLVDDEPFALEILADDISKIPYLELVKSCRSAFEAARVLELLRIDLVFLDIQMPGLSGLQFLTQLKDPPMVIFITAFEQFAVTAFELNAVDYILKPVRFKRLLAASQKALTLHQLRLGPPASQHDQQYLLVKSEYNSVRIPYNDVLYIEGMKDYVKIFCASRSQPILSRINVKNIHALLPEELFCRVHQSFIVSVGRVNTFQKKKLWIQQKEIPIGGRFVDQAKRYFEIKLS
ncbi:LytTR family DNA-binding domain-containing protein [Dyadobacter sp. CY356]|uniref:LytR/AlgR family response regulator transcription factor n=1 Tax=Dyadobacter sp. CY356 TaxID=2906442 RepID=UPI001F1A844C|nr:response regulator transcription factor [Dyadobacter sp. CY356]MCF0059104.1 response regulator transcription factor [Dyadobacter sp. CY356]